MVPVSRSALETMIQAGEAYSVPKHIAEKHDLKGEIVYYSVSGNSVVRHALKFERDTNG